MLSSAPLRRTTLVSSTNDTSSTDIVSQSIPNDDDSNNKSKWTNRRRAGLCSGLSSCCACPCLPIWRRRGGVAITAATQKDAARNEFARRLLVAAIVTLLFEGAIGHLLEFVKIVMQTSPAGTTYSDVIRSITAEKGIAGAWDGFIPWGAIQAIGKGGIFGFAHAVAKGYLIQPLIDRGTLPSVIGLTLAGGIAGGFQGYVLSPILLLKTRVMTNDVFRENISSLRTTVLSLTIGCNVVRQEGFLSLMKGSNVFAMKRVFDWSTRYFFSGTFESFLIMRNASNGKLTATEKIIASLLGGTASTISTLPLDVLVAKIQDAKKAGETVSALKIFFEELEEMGLGGLHKSYMKGFEARLAHVCLTTVAMKVGTVLLYDAMYCRKS